jgi:peptide/nickel transport system permease protein
VLAFITRRVLIAIPTLLIFSFGIFAILYESGDPTASLRATQKLDPTTVAKILDENGFNDPFFERYCTG